MLSASDVSRRRLLQALAAGASAAWIAPPVLAGAEPALRDRRVLMGTWVDMSLDGAPPARLADARDAAWAEMQRLATMMSRFVPGNALDRINAAAGREPVKAPRELIDVVRAGRLLSNLTAGAFDMSVGALGWRFGDDAAPTLPSPGQIRTELQRVGYRDVVVNHCESTVWLRRAGMKLDLGGIAKLPILAAGLDVLARHGVPSAMVNGGGDVLVRAEGPTARPWRIGIRDAAAPQRLLAVLPLRNGVVASSGDYERGFDRGGRRYHHVLDPATGYPTEQVRGVTLLAQHVDDVNGLGTAAMVLGPDRGAALLAASPSRQALLVRRDGGLWAAPQLAARLEAPPGQRVVRGLA